tara:strand:- start:8149 stop:8352 length:204 start_codon:yes stop_codon:yes gene_type:complete
MLDVEEMEYLLDKVDVHIQNQIKEKRIKVNYEKILHNRTNNGSTSNMVRFIKRKTKQHGKPDGASRS